MNIYKNHKMNRLKTLAGIYNKKPLNESIIREYDDDALIGEFVNAVKSNQNDVAVEKFIEMANTGVIQYYPDYEQLFKQISAGEFQEFLNTNAAKLYHSMFDQGEVTYPLAPSLLSIVGITTPNVYFDYIRKEDAMDDLFGIIYEPRRLKKRYQPGAREILANILLSNADQVQNNIDLFYEDDIRSFQDDISKVFGEKVYQSLLKRMPKAM